MKAFRERGGDLGAFLERRKKVGREVVEAAEAELKEDFWVSLKTLAERVNRRLGGEDFVVSSVERFDRLEHAWGFGSGLRSEDARAILAGNGARRGTFQGGLCPGSGVCVGLSGCGTGSGSRGPVNLVWLPEGSPPLTLPSFCKVGSLLLASEGGILPEDRAGKAKKGREVPRATFFSLP